MVTAALFESLLLPLCVLFTVPMALIGVFLMFFYTDAHFTREASIGVIMMGGIVVNNAILLVDHINRLRKSGSLSLREAILQGTMDRVRPILMTSTTTIMGMLPPGPLQRERQRQHLERAGLRPDRGTGVVYLAGPDRDSGTVPALREPGGPEDPGGLLLPGRPRRSPSRG